MRKIPKRIIVGTLLCTMAFSVMPVQGYGNEVSAHVNAAAGISEDNVLKLSEVFVSYPYTFPMGQHLEEGIIWKDCTFESTDTSVAVVNEEGVVFSLSNGSVEITATTKDGKKDSCTLHVIDNENVTYLLEDGYNKTGIITGPIPEGARREAVHKSAVLRIASTIHEGYQVKKIAESAFENANHLEKVVLPETAVYVQEKAFANCENLKTVIVPNMDTMFEEDAFEGDEIVLKGYKGSKAEEFAEGKENITFKVLNPEKDDYAPYEEAIYFSQNNRCLESQVIVAAGEEENVYPAVASMHYGVSDITYTSEDSKIATVENGVIKGKKAGTVTVTASLPNGVKKQFDVKVEGDGKEETKDYVSPASQEEQEIVKDNAEEKVKIKVLAKKASLKVGKTYQFKAVAVNSDKSLKWSISNKKVASIQKTTGKLKAKKAGKATINITCGTVVKKLNLKVKK